MNISDCELILALAEEENITKTAERLYTSQSAISYRLKVLEKELNTELFTRSKNGITPTRQCGMVIDFARDSLARYEALQKAIRSSSSSDEISGTVRLGSTTSIATHVLRKLLQSFSILHPNVNVSLYANNNDVILNMLHESRIDIALTRGNFEEGVPNRLLYEEPIYIVSKENLEISDLPDSPFLMHPNSNAKSTLQKWWFERFHSHLEKFIEIDNIESCLQMVDQNFGWTMLPAITLIGKKKYSLIQMKWADGSPVLRKTWCFLNPESDNARSRAFYNYLIENVPRQMETLFGGKR